MNNIWKYSLVLAFSIICDQLTKGSIQSLLEYEGATYSLIDPILSVIRERNYGFLMGITFGLSPKLTNGLCAGLNSFLMMVCLYRIVVFRNTHPILGWGYTLLFSGLFTSWLDRLSQGFTLNYFLIGKGPISTSLGDLLFLSGLIIIALKEFQRVKYAADPT
ncbi:MAG: signal peptidase II [Halobacteriovoraceae bacterium]|nr:signal peptidase II [Halobacteriovoraceae bacterium]